MRKSHSTSVGPILLVLACAATLASCNKTIETTCSGADSVSVTEKLMSDQVIKDAIAKAKDSNGAATLSESEIRAAVSLLKFDVSDIRTTKSDPDSTKRFCTGTIKVVFPLNVLQDADSARSMAQLGSVNDLAQSSGVQRDADAFTFSLDYNVQPTDDRTSIFAESDSLDPQAQFLAEVVSSYLAKSKLVSQQQAQEQAANQAAAQQAQLDQQARQANLDEATAENKLSVQTINATWQAIDPQTRSQILDIQRAWIKSKDANCRIQAAGASTDATEQETARLKCDTAANQQRIDWLKQYVPGGGQ
jgi:uncharacterized protein YecT (DUF1311 family)